MPRKKRSEMTARERQEYILNGATWEEAEEVGIEILARCMALHCYAIKDGETYYKKTFNKLIERICKRADEWAHEGNNPFVLAMAAVAHKHKKTEN